MTTPSKSETLTPSWAVGVQAFWLGLVSYSAWILLRPHFFANNFQPWPHGLLTIALVILPCWFLKTGRIIKNDDHRLKWVSCLTTLLLIACALPGPYSQIAWVLLPALTLAGGSLLASDLVMIGKQQQRVRASNLFVYAGAAALVGLTLEALIPTTKALWTLIVMALALAPAFFVMPSRPFQSTQPELITSKIDMFLSLVGPLFFAAWLATTLKGYLYEIPSDMTGGENFLPLAFILATLIGGGFAYRGLGRFGAYRHLCQTALLTMLISVALSLPYPFWSWLIAGCFIFYLLGHMGVALLCLMTADPTRSGRFPGYVGFCFTLLVGSLLGLLIEIHGVTYRSLWIQALLLFTALMALQHRIGKLGEPSADALSNWALPKITVDGDGRHHLISRFMRRCARIIAEIFFSRIRIVGAENLRLNTGAILVANHPNTFLDPLILTALSPGRLHYWAKSTLWNLPMLGSILDRMGAIPVFRKKDVAAGQTSGDNQLSIALAARKIMRGGWLLIFPEGGSHTGLSLKPLKTGTARVAFRALQESKWEQDVAILPVALDYLEPSVFRSDLTIRIGEPVFIKPHRAAFEENPRAAVLAITDQVSHALKEALPHLEDPELETLVHQVGDLYGEQISRIMGEDDATNARKVISQAVNHYQKMDPDTLLLFNQRMRTYHQEKSRLSTPENHDPIKFKDLLKIFIKLFSFVTYGIITNWLPYRMVSRVVTYLSPSSVWLGTAKLGWGAVIFGSYYLIFGLITYRLFGGLVAFLVIASFIISAFMALGSLDRFAFRVRQLKLVWQAFWTQDTNDDLEEMKMSLLQDLEHFREAYAYYSHQAESLPEKE